MSRGGFFVGLTMRPLRDSPRLFAALLLGATPLSGDTLYQTNAQGKQVVIHRDAIVVKEDSSFLIYKHFELRERRVVKVRLSKGSLPYLVDRSSPSDRQRIVATWKRFGHTATVTDLAGKSTTVFDVYLDYYPPGGRGSLLESVPPRTTLPILLAAGGADEFEFSRIERVEFQAERLKVTLRSGRAELGQFLKPTDQPVEARLLGITDHYDPAGEEVFNFSVPLDRLKAIQFEP